MYMCVYAHLCVHVHINMHACIVSCTYSICGNIGDINIRIIWQFGVQDQDRQIST